MTGKKLTSMMLGNVVIMLWEFCDCVLFHSNFDSNSVNIYSLSGYVREMFV